jgi:hypothetical protein
VAEYYFPAMAQLSSPEDKFTFLSQQAAAIAQAMVQAKARGDTVDLANLRNLLLKVRGDSITLTGEAQRAEMPSQFMQTLSGFSDYLSSLLGGALDATQKALDILPLLLVGIVAVIGIGLYKGSLSAKVPLVF